MAGCALQVPFQEGIRINQPFWEWCFHLGALDYCLLNNVQNQRQCGKSERGQISWNKSMQCQQSVQISKLLNFGKYHTLRCLLVSFERVFENKIWFHWFWNETAASLVKCNPDPCLDVIIIVTTEYLISVLSLAGKKLQVCDILYQYCSPPKNEEKNFSEMIIEINGYIGNRWLGNVEGNHSLITSLTYTDFYFNWK